MSRWRNKFVQLLKNTNYETSAFIFVNNKRYKISVGTTMQCCKLNSWETYFTSWTNNCYTTRRKNRMVSTWLKKNPAKTPASISYLRQVSGYFKLDSIMDSGLDCHRTFETGLLNANPGILYFLRGYVCKVLKHENNISYFMVI